MIRKLIAVWITLLLAGAVTAPVAWAAQTDDTMTIVWEMPSWNGNNPTWPQQYVKHAANVGLSISTPECGFFQVDVYKYASESDQTKVDNLISGGVLSGPNNPPEPLIPGGLGTAWKFVNNGGCETESPTPTPTETPSDTPEPTPTESTASPSPSGSTGSGTPSPSVTTPSPSETAPSPSGSSSPSVTPTTPDDQPPTTLPRTGFPTVQAIGLGVLAILAGIWALVSTRRGKHA